MKKKIALVCVAKEEDYYLQEWIDYHLMIGFDDIHIFQNDWRFKNPIPNKRVHFHEWDVKTIENNQPIWERDLQAKCYTEFARNNYDKYEWTAFFDVDEFLVLKQHSDVKDFIDDYFDYNCVVINWALFGDNGITEFDGINVSVLERFTKRWDKPHTEGYYQFKGICRLSKDMVHNVHWSCGEWVDVHFNMGNEPKIGTPTFDRAQLNHYYTKTYPEWVNKANRTRCDTGRPTLPVEAFNGSNFNDVDDFTALEFFKKK